MRKPRSVLLTLASHPENARRSEDRSQSSFFRFLAAFACSCHKGIGKIRSPRHSGLMMAQKFYPPQGRLEHVPGLGLHLRDIEVQVTYVRPYQPCSMCKCHPVAVDIPVRKARTSVFPQRPCKILRCVSSTAFGTPVLPEVKKKTLVSSCSTNTARCRQGACRSRSSPHPQYRKRHPRNTCPFSPSPDAICPVVRITGLSRSCHI